MRLAASLDQASQHVIAEALVVEARRRNLALSAPSIVVETPGEGLEGVVQGRSVVVGGLRFVAERVNSDRNNPFVHNRSPGSVMVAVAVDGRMVATLVLADAVREGAADILAQLRTLGVERIVVATGDRREVAEAVAAALPVDAVWRT